MANQLPFMRALKNITRPKGIAMRPRPAAGIAHMGRPRSPIHLDVGGSTGQSTVGTVNPFPLDLAGLTTGPTGIQSTAINAGQVPMNGNYNFNTGTYDPGNTTTPPTTNPPTSTAGSALSLPGIISNGLGGLAGAAGTIYQNQGRPVPIASKPTNNPFAIPNVQRSIDPSTQSIVQSVTGYSAFPGSNAPANGSSGMFGNYAPGTNSGAPQHSVTSGSVMGGAPVQAAPTVATNGGLASGVTAPAMGNHFRRMATGGGVQGGQSMPGEAPEEGQNKATFMDAVMALEGKSPDPQKALRDFLQHWGPQALQELQQHVRGGQAQPGAPMQPNAPQAQQGPSQPQGIKSGILSGPGDGMSDNIPSQRASDGQRIQLSDSEYVVPSDAVAMLGNGSSTAGARKLDAGIAKLRQMKYGRAKQPPKLAANHNPILNH